MKIGIVGLGLIGGSFAKAIKAKTDFTVLGYDKNAETMEKALDSGAADKKLEGRLGECDILLLAVYPQQAVEFIRENADLINPDTVVTDCCGTKTYVCEHIGKIAKEKGFTFIGGHPMAGIERFGFDWSKPDLFEGASMILVPENKDEEKINVVIKAFEPLGFGHFEVTTAEHHDRIIAYTSQLAHVVSSAYIQSPAAEQYFGFSAGSFKDMTRVARLNETMWTELFCENNSFLADEIDSLIERLGYFSKAIRGADEKEIYRLLENGCNWKERSDSVGMEV